MDERAGSDVLWDEVGVLAHAVARSLNLHDDGVVQQSIDNALLRRRCTIDDIAEAIVFLSCAAAMATGQMLVMDGGLNL
jgi:NAD(P)-dependent dehydrogenase (short-subunit alcohol dehydrogenase family)